MITLRSILLLIIYLAVVGLDHLDGLGQPANVAAPLDLNRVQNAPA